MPLPAYGCASAVIAGKIHVIGGSKIPGTAGTGAFVNSNQVYDPQTNSWGLSANLPTDSTYAAADSITGFMAPPQLYVVGGFNANSFSNTVQIYNAAETL